jgi:hypothetical protein
MAGLDDLGGVMVLLIDILVACVRLCEIASDCVGFRRITSDYVRLG